MGEAPDDDAPTGYAPTELDAAVDGTEAHKACASATHHRRIARTCSTVAELVPRAKMDEPDELPRRFDGKSLLDWASDEDDRLRADLESVSLAPRSLSTTYRVFAPALDTRHPRRGHGAGRPVSMIDTASTASEYFRR